MDNTTKRSSMVGGSSVLSLKGKNRQIEKLVNDINDSLDVHDQPGTDVSNDDEIISAHNDNASDKEHMSDSEAEEDKPIKKKTKNSEKVSLLTKYFPNFMKEPLLIVVVYVVLSQPMIRDAIGKYVPQIGCHEDGSPSLPGVLLYGIILAMLFMILKKILL